MKKWLFFLISILFASPALAWDGVASTIASGRKVVTTPGTAVKLMTNDTACTKVIVTALSTDTGVVCVGDSAVKANALTREGTPLTAGQSFTIPINDVSKVYIDATVTNEGVSFTYFK